MNKEGSVAAGRSDMPILGMLAVVLIQRFILKLNFLFKSYCEVLILFVSNSTQGMQAIWQQKTNSPTNIHLLSLSHLHKEHVVLDQSS